MIERKVAILGYGNQGRAHALNLRDSGVSVVVGCRQGKGRELAIQDGWQPLPLQEAALEGEIVVFLLPDLEISPLYHEIYPEDDTQRVIGFAHSFPVCYGNLQRRKNHSFFLVAPKGAGVLLRERYLDGTGLPAGYAVQNLKDSNLATEYAKAIGCGKTLIPTTFQQEVEGDLFGEQAVLLGGLLHLLEASVTTLVKNGHPPQSAFLDTVFEASLILKLLCDLGPQALSEKVSTAALFGGYTEGKKVLGEGIKERLEAIFQKIRNGDFAQRLQQEAEAGFPLCQEAKDYWRGSNLEKGWRELWKK